MSNTSATGGYIPEGIGVASHSRLEDIVHDMLAGLTGFSNTLVRPAFQFDALKAPLPTENWCAFDLRNQTATNEPEIRHVPDGDGHDEVLDQMDYEAFCFFYGPHADDYAGMVRRALHIEQNRWAMRQAGIAVCSIGNPTQVPELVNNKWQRRVDLSIYITYEAVGTYDVLNLLRASGPIMTDHRVEGGTLEVDYDTNNVKG